MDPLRVRELLSQVASGATNVDEAFQALRDLPYRDVGIARVDHHRALRQGIPEVIFGERKTVDHMIAIAQELLRAGENVMITRLTPEKASPLCAALPALHYESVAQIASFEASPAPKRKGTVAVVTAGTSDISIAEEAAETLRLIGIETLRFYDVGVAGIHRLLDVREKLAACQVVIAVAGMEGALPSVVGGLVPCPVIAVPTSVGYGAHLGGLTPLLAMLTTCAAGVVVVNIDNGFGAAIAAHRMLIGL